MRRICLFMALCGALALMTPVHAAGKYDGWTGNDCVGMGDRCIANCDKYGVPETKAGCMFNCARAAMQCIDVVKGEAAEVRPGGTGTRPGLHVKPQNLR